MTTVDMRPQPAQTRAARQAARLRFDEVVDPDGRLPVDTRARFAEVARKSHLRAMTRRSTAVRRTRAEADTP